jgi:hypothetical protein
VRVNDGAQLAVTPSIGATSTTRWDGEIDCGAYAEYVYQSGKASDNGRHPGGAVARAVQQPAGR